MITFCRVIFLEENIGALSKALLCLMHLGCSANLRNSLCTIHLNLTLLLGGMFLPLVLLLFTMCFIENYFLGTIQEFKLVFKHFHDFSVCNLRIEFFDIEALCCLV
jgi:hypothetical protein